MGFGLRGFDSCGVDEHDGNVVLDGVDTAAVAALQAVAVVMQNDRFLANRADQHIEKIFRNHGVSILAPTSANSDHPERDDTIESLFNSVELQFVEQVRWNGREDS
jgi:hypothetical protein